VSDTPCTLQPNVSLPARLRAGDKLAWNVQTMDLDAGTVLFYILTGIIGNIPTRLNIGQTGTPLAGGVAIDATGLAAFTLTSSATATWQPGSYQWILFAVDTDGNRDQLAQGKIRIEADPAGTNPADPRTRDEKLLHQVQCLLEGKAQDDVQMYKIGGRELTKMPLKELWEWEGMLAARVRKERMRRGEKVRSNTVGIVFGGR
jgi:hypothetical protein